MRRILFSFLLGSVFNLLSAGNASAELPLGPMNQEEIRKVQSILAKLEPKIREREAQENLATLSFEELYAPLDPAERDFVRLFQDFDPVAAGFKTVWHGIADGNVPLAAIRGQTIRKNGKLFVLPAQYSPPEVYQAYQRMMATMEKDLGKKLLIESGYRSSAYQLYLFLSYLQNHDYSVRETAHWNAFPGYSEHGDPRNQALDFINEEAISGENDPEAFAVLPEYQWLTRHAARYHFELSFPKKDPRGIGFEPWHWRYTGHKNVAPAAGNDKNAMPSSPA